MVLVLVIEIVMVVTDRAADDAALRCGGAHFVRTSLGADTLPASALSLAFYTAPHLFGHAEALAAASLVPRTRVGTS
jgi:hypothetical protein